MLKLQAIGHLGKDAEVKQVGEKTVINFSVAHTEKVNGESKTIWVECAKWGDKTAVAQYLKKGTQVFVEGTPEVRTWEKDGKGGASLKLFVTNLQLLGNANREEPAAATAVPATGAGKTATPASSSGTADDLPF